jgi:hypothetical protein
MYISAMLQQQGDHSRVPTSRSNVERCPAMGISGVDLGALSQQHFHLHDISCFRCLQQYLTSTLRCLALTPIQG